METLARRGAKLNLTDKDGNTGIHIACDRVKNAPDVAEEYFRVVKAFAEGGVDRNEKNSYGQSALDIAVKNGAKKIAAYLAGTLTEDADAAADSVKAGGMTLHQAAERGDAEAINAIAKSGADLNALKYDDERRPGGCSALAIACAYLRGEAVEALLANGADPSFKDGEGRTAVSCLISGLEASLHSGVFNEKRIPKIIGDMAAAGMDINETVNDDADTLLILACKSERDTSHNSRSVKGDIIDTALVLNADVKAANRFGETALMHACARDFDMMENVQITLLERGADPAAADRNGDTALHYAARNDDKNGAKVLCDMLLEFGADAAAVNNAGQTALDIAAETGNEPLVKLLLAKT